MEKKKYDIFAMLKRMLAHLKKVDPMQIVRIVVYTVLAGIYPFMEVILPKLAIGTLETYGTHAGKPLIFSMGIYFCIAGLLAVSVSYLYAYIQTRNMRIRILYLADLCEKLQTMDYANTENAKFYEENDRAMNAGNNNVRGIEGVYNRVSLLPAKCLTLIGMIILAGALNPLLLVALVLHVLVTMWASKKTHDYSYSKKEEVAKAERKVQYFQKTTQDFSYGKDIRIFDLRERVMKNYHSEILAYTALKKKIANREYILGFAGLFTLLLTNVLTYGILVMQVLNGMSISSFSMYTAMITSLMALMLDFGQDLSFIWSEGQYVDDFYKLLDKNLISEGEKTAADALAGGKHTLEIVFDHVTFRYPNTDKNIFTDLCFTIHSGERLAIVGINGAGKTTLVKLMTGLFAPTEGHIYINGMDINTFRKKELFQLYSAVFQDVNIFAFTIRENVACKSEDVDDEKVKTALDKVGLWKKVEGFEKGLDQMMLKVIDENGTDFSGGERQKLSIARGLYKDAPMVIMDEPTAALDALAEAEIYENFSALVEGKTAVYISHRLASTKFCDKIALFDNDGLREYGTHEELMAQQGKYYEMFVIQGKYYQEDVAV